MNGQKKYFLKKMNVFIKNIDYYKKLRACTKGIIVCEACSMSNQNSNEILFNSSSGHTIYFK